MITRAYVRMVRVVMRVRLTSTSAHLHRVRMVRRAMSRVSLQLTLLLPIRLRIMRALFRTVSCLASKSGCVKQTLTGQVVRHYVHSTKAAFRSTFESLTGVAALGVTTLPRFQVHVAVVAAAKTTNILKPNI